MVEEMYDYVGRDKLVYLVLHSNRHEVEHALSMFTMRVVQMARKGMLTVRTSCSPSFPNFFANSKSPSLNSLS